MKRLLPIVLLLCPVLASAQTQKPSYAQAHHMNSLILETLDQYIQTASFPDESAVSEFVRLFEDRSTPCVFNDLIGTQGYKTTMTPREYASSIEPDNGNLLKFEISQVRKNGDFFYSGGKWHRRISFNKYLLYIDTSVYTGEAGGVFFETDRLFGSENGHFQLVMDLVYDPAEDRCLIARISPLGEVQESALDKGSFYVILQPEDERAASTLYNGSPLEFNEYGQAFVNDLSKISYASEDYAVHTSQEASSLLYEVRDLKFRKLHHFRFKPRYSMALGNAFNLDEFPNGISFNSSSKASEAGLDVGFLFLKGKKSHTGLYTGAAYSMSSLSMSAGGFSYNYLPSREYSITSAEESLAFKDLMIPLYVEHEHNIGKYINLTLDLGAKFYVAQGSEISSPYTVSGTVNGGNSFTVNSQSAGFLDPGCYAKQPYDLSFFGNMEVDVRIINPVWVFVSAGYEFQLPSVLPTYQPDEMRTYYALSSGTPVFPVVYGGGQNLLFRSFVQSVRFHRQSIWLSFGLKFKLNI